MIPEGFEGYSNLLSAESKNPRKRAFGVHKPTAVPNAGDSQVCLRGGICGAFVIFGNFSFVRLHTQFNPVVHKNSNYVLLIFFAARKSILRNVWFRNYELMFMIIQII